MLVKTTNSKTVAINAPQFGRAFENALCERLNEGRNGVAAKPLGEIIMLAKGDRFNPHAVRRKLGLDSGPNYAISFRQGPFKVSHNNNAADAFIAAAMHGVLADLKLVPNSKPESHVEDKGGLRLSTLVGRIADALDAAGIPVGRDDVEAQVQSAVSCLRKGDCIMTFQKRIESSLSPLFTSPQGYRQAEFTAAMRAIGKIVEDHDFPLLYVKGQNGKFMPALEISLPEGAGRLDPGILAQRISEPLSPILDAHSQRRER